MRTKAELVYSLSAELDYDIFIFVETWLNPSFYDNEFFDSNIFNVFRKDRDAAKTGCLRGGGVLIAVKRHLSAFLFPLINEDSLLDQICVCISCPTSQDSIYLLASYLPPDSSFELYKAHVDNIVYLVINNLNDNHLCVLGDFNLSKINWCTSISNFTLTPNNVSANHELYFIDNILSLNLYQINKFVNSLNRILDLIFVSDNLSYKISECLNPITPKDKHHVPLVVKLDFYFFASVPSVDRLSFNYSLCDFANFNDLLLDINWDNLFAKLDTSNSFSAFKSTLSKLCLDNIPLRKKKPYKLPWYSKDLKKLKNLKNNCYKKFKSTKNHLYFVKYKRT